MKELVKVPVRSNGIVRIKRRAVELCTVEKGEMNKAGIMPVEIRIYLEGSVRICVAHAWTPHCVDEEIYGNVDVTYDTLVYEGSDVVHHQLAFIFDNGEQFVDLYCDKDTLKKIIDFLSK